MNNFKRVLAGVLTATVLSTAVSVTGVSALTTKISDNTKANVPKFVSDSLKDEQSYVEGEAVVMMKGTGVLSSGSSLNEDVSDISDDIVVENVDNFNDKRDGFTVATVSSKELSTEELVSQLNESDDIEIAEPNYIYKALDVTNDSYSKLQWALEDNGQNGSTTGNDINPTSLWNNSSSDKEQVVAVLDTGVDYTNEDLKNKMWVNPYKNKLSGVYGFDFSGDNKDHSPMDDNGHGTHCAGIIAAEQNNNTGVAGVSPNTKIMAVKWLDSDGSGSISSAVSAYNYVYRAMKLGVNVVAINNSWGGNDNSEILTELINKVGKLGAVSVCAAGNDGVDIDEETNLEDYYDGSDNYYDDDDDYYGKQDSDDISNYVNAVYPANCDSEYVISVAASNESGELASYSNYGENSVDVIAPGSDILSTVSYNCFNPGIYEDVNSKCTLYETKNFTAQQNDDGDGTATISQNNELYFSDYSDDKNALQWEIKGAKAGDTYSLEIPYTVENISQKPWVSAMLNITQCPEIDYEELVYEAFLSGNYNAIMVYDTPAESNDTSTVLDGCIVSAESEAWTHISLQTNNKKSGERKLVLKFNVVFAGDYTFTLDNIGISKGSANEEQSFGKYDYMSGTSMATPAVAGAVALIKENNPNMTVQEVCNIIKGSVKQKETYEGKVASAGAIDLSKTKALVPEIESVTVKSGKTTIKGKNFTNATVTVDGKAIQATVKEKEIVISDQSFLNSNVTIKVTNSNGYAVKKALLINGTKYTELGSASNYFYDYNFASDGKYVYYVNEYGIVERYSVPGMVSTKTYDDALSKHFKSVINDSNYYFDISSVTYYNGYLYFIADLNLFAYYGIGDIYSSILNDDYNAEDMYAVYGTESVIVKMNVSSGKFSYINYDDNIQKPSLGILNGTLYLVGGIVDGQVSQNVYKYSSSKWVNATALPSGRAMGKCVQVNNTQMVYTLGTDGTANVPKNLIFNGSKWTESNKQLVSSDSSTATVDDKEFVYYDGGVSLISGGLLYTGNVYENYGDTVKYKVSNDTYSHISKYFKSKNNDIIRGLVVNNKFYGTSCQLYTTESYDYYTGETYEYTDVASMCYTFGVTSGMYTISANASHGKVSGTGAYYPGETVTLKATANKNYKVKSITVNGKTYNKNTVSFKATKSTKVTVKYTSLVSSIKLSSINKTLNLKKNKTFNLTAKINPTGATNKTLNWKNSKSSVVSMKKVNNTTVKLTAKKKGTAVITASAKDGSKKSAKCTVKVK